MRLWFFWWTLLLGTLAASFASADDSAPAEAPKLYTFPTSHLQLHGSVAQGILLKLEDQKIVYELRPKHTDKSVELRLRIIVSGNVVDEETIPEDLERFIPHDASNFFDDGIGSYPEIQVKDAAGKTVGEIRVMMKPRAALAASRLKESGDVRIQIFEGSVQDGLWKRNEPWIRSDAFLGDRREYYLDLFSSHSEPPEEIEQSKVHRSWWLKE